jgi:hypothetical protein
MMTKSSTSGGLKGLLQRTGKFFYASGIYARDIGTVIVRKGYHWGGNFAFAIATASVVTLFPLLFEIQRERQVSSDNRRQLRRHLLIKLTALYDFGSLEKFIRCWKRTAQRSRI